jgi:hypothetical protein
MKWSVPVTVFAALIVGPPTSLKLGPSASAAELAPGAAASISLGEVSGVAYFTAESDGYRVVTTLAAGPDASPVRFVATLSAGQTITVSVPRPRGTPDLRLDIARRGNALVTGEACSGCASDVRLVQSADGR